MQHHNVPDWKAAFYIGSADDPAMYLTWWYDHVGKEGLHFDLLEPVDTLASKNFLELKALARASGIFFKHTKRVHLILALRDPPPNLSVTATRHIPVQPIPTRRGQRSIPGLRMLQWNVCSLRSRKHDLAKIIAETSPHIISLQETWAKSEEALAIANYCLVSWSSRPPSQKGGGVALYAHHDVVWHALDVTSATHCELCCGRFVFEGSTVTILSGYIPPPSSACAPATNDDLAKIFATALGHKPDFVCGDFNCEADTEMTGAR